MAKRFIAPAVVALLTLSCGEHTLTIKPPEAPEPVDSEGQECDGEEAKAFMTSQIEDLQRCAAFLSCKKHPERTLTLMVGCNGTEGGLFVLSHQNLKNFNECIASKGEEWDYSPLCTTEESECTWTMKLDLVCTKK